MELKQQRILALKIAVMEKIIIIFNVMMVTLAQGTVVQQLALTKQGMNAMEVMKHTQIDAGRNVEMENVWELNNVMMQTLQAVMVAVLLALLS